MCPFPRFSTVIAANRQQSQPIRLGDFTTGLFKTATSLRSAKKIAKCVRINGWRKSPAIFAGGQIRLDRRIKSPGVSLALEIGISIDARNIERIRAFCIRNQDLHLFTVISISSLLYFIKRNNNNNKTVLTEIHIYCACIVSASRPEKSIIVRAPEELNVSRKFRESSHQTVIFNFTLLSNRRKILAVTTVQILSLRRYNERLYCHQTY